jgi:hypothetical protein
MLKKIRTLRNKRNKYSNSSFVRKFFLNETKNHNPPPFKLNGRSLTSVYITQVIIIKQLLRYVYALNNGYV